VNIDFYDLSQLENIANVSTIPGSFVVSSVDLNDNPIASWSQFPIKRFLVETDEVNNCWKLNGISTNNYTFTLNYDTTYWFDVSSVPSQRNFTITDPSGVVPQYFIDFIPGKVKVFGNYLAYDAFTNFSLIKDANDSTFGGSGDNCPHFVFNGYRKIDNNRLLRRNDKILTNGDIDLTIGSGINGDQISIIPLSGTPNIYTTGDVVFMNGATSGTINHSTILFYVDNSWFFKQ
jgi:hypothetical protein